LKKILSSEIKILFYIIVGIIYFISKAYNKEKKKENQRQPNRKPIGGQTAEEIFKELRKQLNLPEDQPVLETSKPKKSSPQPFIPNNETGKRQRLKKEKLVLNRTLFKRKDIVSSENSNYNSDHSDAITQNYDNDIMKDFDAKKAVIFSEILKRPQY
jgi:hypothetical protein